MLVDMEDHRKSTFCAMPGSLFCCGNVLFNYGFEVIHRYILHPSRIYDPAIKIVSTAHVKK